MSDDGAGNVADIGPLVTRWHEDKAARRLFFFRRVFGWRWARCDARGMIQVGGGVWRRMGTVEVAT